MDFQAAKRLLADELETLIVKQQRHVSHAMPSLLLSDDYYRAAAEGIANKLISEALANGLPGASLDFSLSKLSGGIGADVVFRMRATTGAIVKVELDPKLKKEAKFLHDHTSDISGATPWGELFPRVLSSQLDRPLFAYAMEEFRKEDGYRDLGSWIFDGDLLVEAREIQSKLLVSHVLDSLFNVYRGSKSVDSRPNLEGEAYLGRIEGRMSQADKLFDGFACASVQIGGQRFHSWKHYAQEIRFHRAAAEATFPPFETAVHGDSHPRNIMLRLRSEGCGRFTPQLKLIDPKGWYLGDYLFDLAKLAQHITLTGPIERWGLGAKCKFQVDGGVLKITDLPEIPTWVLGLSKLIESRAVAIGQELGDEQAATRFKFAVASCYLGTLKLRWEQDQKLLAVVMYAEGIRLLAEYCSSLL